VHVDCHLPETGERLWRHSFPCTYSGKYYDNGGPRATPTIVNGRVVVHGAGGRLLCLDLADGELVWERDTAVELKVGDPEDRAHATSSSKPACPQLQRQRDDVTRSSS
jgi:outer membrane protein assembly factor BamB